MTSPVNITSQTKHQVLLDYVLAHAQNDKRPYLHVQIYGLEFLGLLDSGCSITVLGKAGWDQLKHTCILQNTLTNKCTIANGDTCEVIGSVSLPIQLCDRVKIFNILVVPSVPHHLILGMDFWMKMGIIPDMFSGQWTFRSEDMASIPKVNSIHTVEHLTPEQRRELDHLIEETFRDMGDQLGCTSLVEHEIRTNSPPIKQRHYPLSPALQKEVNQQLEQMLADGIIEPSISPWASPIVLVRKSQGGYRFCVNYKKLNEVSLPDAYPLPFVSSTLDKLRDASYLSTLDIKSAYWQIPVAETSRPLTAFVVPTRGLFQFRRMPFGLNNAPATWQRFIDRVIGVDLEAYTFVYLDDIIICTPTFAKHIEVLREVIARIKKAGLTLNREKCNFCKPELRYLGYLVNRSGLMVDPEKVEAILRIPSPASVKEVRRIVGMASWYRRFIPHFSTAVAPLTALLKKNCHFEWTEDCEKSLDLIKSYLVSAPVLTCPNFDLPFIIQTDASDYGLAAVLSQVHEDGEKVICYLSRSLTSSERKYSTTEKECLAVLFAVEKLRPYIEGAHFTVVTDHYSLKWLYNIKDPVGRIARWAVRLQQYDFEIVHRKGSQHVVPDTLSRAVPKLSAIAGPGAPSNTLAIDKWYTRMSTQVNQDPARYPLWRLEGGRLFKRAHLKYPDLATDEDGWLLVVPKGDRKDIIKDNHDPPTCGHLGVSKTLGRISAKYYWPKMKEDVTRYIRHCETCIRTKPEQRRPAGLMLSKSPAITRPGVLLSADIVGPLPRTSAGYSYIFSVCDCFSKFALLFPLRSATASKIVNLLEEQVILIFGAPKRIIVDNGVQFRSHQFKDKMKEYGIQVAYTANYHPQANPVERIHRVIKTMLTAYVADHHKTWDKYLAKVAWALRSARHEATGLTPNFITFGREISLSNPLDSSTLDESIQFVRKDDQTQRAKSLQDLYKDVSVRLTKAYEKSKKVYDLRRREERFKLGQQVWKRNFSISDATKDFTAKLAHKFQGPYKISKILSPWSYELVDEFGKPAGVWHAKDIKAHPPDE